jgi:hypothetical protein
MENASSKEPWNQEIPLAPWAMPPRSWSGMRSSCRSWIRPGTAARGASAGRRMAVLVGQAAALGGGMGSSLRFLQPLTARATVRAGTAIHMSFIVPTLETGRFSPLMELRTMEWSKAADKSPLRVWPLALHGCAVSMGIIPIGYGTGYETLYAHG